MPQCKIWVVCRFVNLSVYVLDIYRTNNVLLLLFWEIEMNMDHLRDIMNKLRQSTDTKSKDRSADQVGNPKEAGSGARKTAEGA